MQSFNPGISTPIMGPDGNLLSNITFFDDFIGSATHTPNKATVADSQGNFSELADMGTWLVTPIDGGTDNAQTITNDDNSLGGIITFTPNDAAADGFSCQVNGEAFSLAAGKVLVMEARIAKGHATRSDFFVGLAITDTSVMTDPSDFIGFGQTGGAADLLAVNGKNAASGEIADAAARAGYTYTDTGVDQVAATFNTVRVEVDGTDTARFYVDGELKATHTGNLPTDEHMTPTIFCRSTTTDQATWSIDYIYVSQTR